MYGGNNNDSLYGSSGNDRMYGQGGNDYLSGSSGNDILVGGSGDDTLVGGSGTDIMTNGNGDDIYRFFSVNDSNSGLTRDILADFNKGFDRIDLSFIDSHLGTAGNQAFNFIGTSAFNGFGSGQVRYFQSGGNTIQVDRQNDGNIIAEMELQLTGIINLAASDFIF